MSKNSKNLRPPPGTPEFDAWLKKRATKRHKTMFEEGFQPVDFENGGVLVGDISDLNKTDAELFPDELDEHSPEDRRRSFKIHKNDN